MILILTFIGWAIAQFSDILNSVSKSKERFDPVYFLKDTWFKIVIAFFLSFSIASGLHLVVVMDVEQTIDVLGIEVKFLYLIYLLIGAVPEIILQKIRKKYGFLKTE